MHMLWWFLKVLKTICGNEDIWYTLSKINKSNDIQYLIFNINLEFLRHHVTFKPHDKISCSSCTEMGEGATVIIFEESLYTIFIISKFPQANAIMNN